VLYILYYPQDIQDNGHKLLFAWLINAAFKFFWGLLWIPVLLIIFTVFLFDKRLIEINRNIPYTHKCVEVFAVIISLPVYWGIAVNAFRSLGF